MSKLLQQLLRRTSNIRCGVSSGHQTGPGLVTRLSCVNIAPGAHNALTNSKLCARLSQVTPQLFETFIDNVLSPQVTIPGTNSLSRWCHNNTTDPEQEIYNGILSAQIKLVKTFSLTTSCIGKIIFEIGCNGYRFPFFQA